MSKSKSKKKVVLTKKQKTSATKVAPTSSRRSRTSTKTLKQENLLFGKGNYTLILAGLALVFFGMIMMLGGSMPDPNTWDPDIIYSTRITVIGPVMIVAGLVVEIYAIFKK